MLDVLNGLLEWYMARADIVMPILLSIFVLGLSLGISGFSKDKIYRTTVVLIPVFVLYAMSFAGGPFGAEFFLNLSTALLTGLFALLILSFLGSGQSWAYATGLVAFLAVVAALFTDPNNMVSSLPANISAALVAAFITTALIRREWDWSPEQREVRLSSVMRQERKQKAKEADTLGDFYVLIPGGDVAEIEEKVKFLKENNLLIISEQPTELDKETGTYYRRVNLKITTVVKNQETLFLANQEARVRVIGFGDTVKRIYKQMDEVLDCVEQKRIDSPFAEMTHIEFKVNAPQKMFSDYIEENLLTLARTWQTSGDDQMAQAAVELVEWGKEMQFVKE